MGAHTFGTINGGTSLGFSYTWVSRGGTLFNNDYYKMITDDTRWYFNDNACTKVGDAYGNRPVRRWFANYRFVTHNKGPVWWISENYVCPNCVQSPNNKCCKNVPEGQFCTHDALNMTEKTPQELKHGGCEVFRFIPGRDETAGSYELGLWFKFKNIDGFPTGCKGFNWKETCLTNADGIFKCKGHSSIEGIVHEVLV